METKPLTGNLLESPIPEQQVQKEAAPQEQEAKPQEQAARILPPMGSVERLKQQTRGSQALLDMAMKAYNRHKSKLK
jgi:hypothetical protein